MRTDRSDLGDLFSDVVRLIANQIGTTPHRVSAAIGPFEAEWRHPDVTNDRTVSLYVYPDDETPGSVLVLVLVGDPGENYEYVVTQRVNRDVIARESAGAGRAPEDAVRVAVGHVADVFAAVMHANGFPEVKNETPKETL